MLTADGYPDNPRKGDQIDGIEQAQHFGDVKLFHAGTKCDAEDRIVTNGGRVLSIVARDVDSFAARERAYRAADMIQFRGRHMRRDIAA